MRINIGYELDPTKKVIEQILEYRGLDKEWVEAGEKHLHSGKLFRNYEKARQMLELHIKNDSRIAIIVDQDQDGMASAAMMHQWLLDKNSSLQITPIIPEGKVHGIFEQLIPECDLLIVPDASSSEGEKHKKLSNRGLDILVLDHHTMSEQESGYAVIVNPQNELCNYPNPHLSGAGVVWKVIREMDEDSGSEDYKKYVDLAALATVADVMSLKELENKAIVNIGIKNIQNPYLVEYLKFDQRVAEKPVNAITFAFYAAPLVNAVIRVGAVEDKIAVYEAMIGEVPAQPVLAKITTLKSGQDRKKDTILPRIVMGLQRKGRDKNRVVIGEAPANLPKSMTGLVAGQLAGSYQSPVILGREKDGSFVGSLRSINDSTIANFREFCEESNLCNWARGHSSAAGVSIPMENIEKFIEYSNENLPEFEKIVNCDFELKEDKADIILQAAEFEDHIGCDVKEVKICDRINVTPRDFQIIGQKQNVLKIEKDRITYIQFKFSGDLPTESCTLRIVGKPNKNEWNGQITPQIIIESWEVEKLEL